MQDIFVPEAELSQGWADEVRVGSGSGSGPTMSWMGSLSESLRLVHWVSWLFHELFHVAQLPSQLQARSPSLHLRG